MSTRGEAGSSGAGAAFRAEVLKLRRRPAIWIVVGVVALQVVYLYAGFYAMYRQEVAGVMLPSVEPQFILQGLMPDQVVQALLENQTSYIYAIGLVLGALTAGSEYGWGTLKTGAAQGPTRLALYLGQLYALVSLLVLLVFLLLALALGASLIVARLQEQPVRWPSGTGLLAGLGAAFLLLAMPATMSMMLATLLRSVPLALGAGLSWFFLIEQGFQSFDSSSPALMTVIGWLPRSNADSLVASFGMWAGSLYPPFSPVQGHAVRFVAALLIDSVVFSAVGAIVFHRRDVA